MLKSTTFSKTKEPQGQARYLVMRLALFVGDGLPPSGASLKWVPCNQSLSQALALQEEKPKVRPYTVSCHLLRVGTFQTQVTETQSLAIRK